MSTKHLSVTSFFFMGIATLSAQTPVAALRQAGMNNSDLSSLVSLIQENALMALLGAIAVMGIVWIFCIWNACAGMNRKPKNTRVSFLSLLLVMTAGLSIFGSSCTAAQKAQAANIRAAQAVEVHYCVCHAPLTNSQYYGHAGINNQYSYHKQSNEQSRAFCKYCGQRVYAANR